MPAADSTSTLTQELRALETVPDSYIVVSPELVILTASNAYLADTLKRRDELVGRYLFDAFPDNPAAPEANAVRNWRASLEHVMATGRPHQMALQHYDVLDPERPGYFVERHWLPRNTPVFDGEGKLRYIIHSSVNVTDEVQARQAMVEAQDREQRALIEVERQRTRLASFLAQAPAAVCVYSGPDFVYELVNASYQQLFGTRPLLGRPLAEAWPEIVGQWAWQHLCRVYETGQAHEEVAQLVPIARADGQGLQDRYFTFRYQPRTTEQGQVDGVLVFAFEVTEQVVAGQQVQRLNQELREANRQLLRVNADLDTFVYTASHDLRSPIANLEGLVTTLRQELRDPITNAPVIEHVLRLIDASIARFQTTIEELTDVIRVQQDGQLALPEQIDISSLVGDICQDLAVPIQESQARIQVEVAQCPFLRFSPKSLRSIFFNLLSNALKYRSPDRQPQIEVHTSCNEQWAELRVQDNGLGLTTEQQQKLFHLFTRLHNHVEGSGVGLYSVHKIVENAGGAISVHSEVGLGSVFTVQLPLSTVDATAAE